MTFRFGVVEATNDPLKNGRCKVRVVGIHNADKVELPTEDLPWATPMQSIFSAATSGVGSSPTGIVNGTWVMVIFTDEDEQNPIMIGTIAGVPSGMSSFVFPNDDNIESTFNPPDVEELPVQRENKIGEEISQDDLYIGSLTKKQYEQYKAAIKHKESSGRPDVVNQLGYIGWYQFGLAALEDLGYIKKGTWSRFKKNSAMDDDSVWTAKNGITSKAGFLNSTSVQDAAFLAIVQNNYLILKRKGVASPDTPPEKLAGLLGVSHNQGAGAAIKYLKGEVGFDGNGVSATEYYNLGFSSVRGNTTLEYPTKDTINRAPLDTAINRPTDNSKYDVSMSPVLRVPHVPESGFADPDGKYPKKDWLNEPDTHRLARNQRVSETIVGDKEAGRVKGIAIGMGSATWNQPAVPYNTKYPYNKVTATESGHVIEIDDTPECERINIHHSSGTFTEVDSNGTQTNRIVGHGCTIIEKDNLVLIKGSGHVHIEGNITLHIAQSVFVECGDSINFKAKNINFDAEEAITMTSKEVNAKGDASVSIEGAMVGVTGSAMVGIKAPATNIASAAINQDGYVSTNVGMATAAVAAITPVVKKDMQYTGSVQELYVKTRKEEADFLLEGTDEAAAMSLRDSINSVEEVVKEEAEAMTTKQEPSIVNCDLVLPLRMDTQISTNFTLANYCIDGGFPFNGQHGMSANEIACNLKNLSVNVVEPLFGRYREKGIKINSGVRVAGGGISTAKGISQHEKGEAVDIGFSKIRGLPNDRELYFQLAKEIQNSVPFDQLLLEYTNTGSVWIHLSFTTKRPLRYQVLTLNNHKTVGQGLILLGPKE